MYSRYIDLCYKNKKLIILRILFVIHDIKMNNINNILLTYKHLPRFRLQILKYQKKKNHTDLCL